MRVAEVILEISQAEKRRRDDQRKKQEFAARQQAQRDEQERKAAADQARKELARRKIAAQLRVPEPPPPVEDEPKIDPDNPLAALYAQQQEQERAQEDEIYGVDFKFQTVINKKTREKRLYGFWTRERIQRLEDVMRSGQYRDFGNFKGTNEEAISMFQLMKEIGEKYRQVYVFFDRENMQQFPGLREVLNRFKDNYKITRNNKIPFGYRLNPNNKEIEQFIAWEEVDRPPESFVTVENNESQVDEAEALGRSVRYSFYSIFELVEQRPGRPGLKIRQRRDRPTETRQSGIYVWHHPDWGYFYVGIAAADNFTERWNKHIQKLLDQCTSAKQMRNWKTFADLFSRQGYGIEDLKDVTLRFYPRPHPGTPTFKQELKDIETRIVRMINPMCNYEYDSSRPSATRIPPARPPKEPQ